MAGARTVGERDITVVRENGSHRRKLKDARLVKEERRGRWSFYSLDRRAAQEMLAHAADHLDSPRETGAEV